LELNGLALNSLIKQFKPDELNIYVFLQTPALDLSGQSILISCFPEVKAYVCLTLGSNADFYILKCQNPNGYNYIPNGTKYERKAPS
jgi:hypothetical protein